MTTRPIETRLEQRRAVLMQRLDAIMEKDRRGEGSTTWLELELLADEFRRIEDLTRTLLMMAIKERVVTAR